MRTTTLLLGIICSSLSHILAQCPAGQVEVTIDVGTDQYGYEIYWELLPNTNICGTGTIFAGGNTNVGCNGGGVQAQDMSGYGNNLTINEGPWCLTEATDYDIYFVDDWGDGGVTYTVNIGGYPIYSFAGTGTDERYTFTASGPPAMDVEMINIETFDYVEQGNIDIRGDMKNVGTTTITSLDLNYSIDNGTTVTQTLTGLNISPICNVRIHSRYILDTRFSWNL